MRTTTTQRKKSKRGGGPLAHPAGDIAYAPREAEYDRYDSDAPPPDEAADADAPRNGSEPAVGLAAADRAAQAMPFLCSLGFHRPERVARWNEGYYFTRCERCARDLVRLPDGPWFVPRGYRVVWLTEPPAAVKPARLVAENGSVPGPQADGIGAAFRARYDRWRAAREATEAGAELPINDVLRALRSSGDDRPDAVTAEAPEPAGVPFEDAPAPRPDPAEATLEPDTAGYALRQDVVDSDYEEAEPLLLTPERDGAVPVGGHERGPRAATQGLIALALLAVTLLAAVTIGLLRANDGQAPAAAIPRKAGVQETAFVNARIVNCRASPIDRAVSVRKLARGTSVSVLAREEGWTSVSIRGRQCWVASRYVSREAPI